MRFFDLHKHLTLDKNFLSNVIRITKDIEKYSSKEDKEKMREHILLLLRLCNYNPSLLVPYFFPNFVNNTPMTFWSRPHAFAMFTTGANLSLTVQASRQVGKCLEKDTRLIIKRNNAVVATTIEDLWNSTK